MLFFDVYISIHKFQDKISYKMLLLVTLNVT